MPYSKRFNIEYINSKEQKIITLILFAIPLLFTYLSNVFFDWHGFYFMFISVAGVGYYFFMPMKKAQCVISDKKVIIADKEILWNDIKAYKICHSIWKRIRHNDKIIFKLYYSNSDSISLKCILPWNKNVEYYTFINEMINQIIARNNFGRANIKKLTPFYETKVGEVLPTALILIWAAYTFYSFFDSAPGSKYFLLNLTLFVLLFANFIYIQWKHSKHKQ